MTLPAVVRLAWSPRQTLAEFHRVWPIWSQFGRTCPKLTDFGQIWAICGQVRPMSTTFAPKSANFGPVRPNLAEFQHIRAIYNLDWLALTKHRPDSTSFGIL